VKERAWALEAWAGQRIRGVSGEGVRGAEAQESNGPAGQGNLVCAVNGFAEGTRRFEADEAGETG
jgi:hypothetical protein